MSVGTRYATYAIDGRGWEGVGGGEEVVFEVAHTLTIIHSLTHPQSLTHHLLSPILYSTFLHQSPTTTTTIMYPADYRISLPISPRGISKLVTPRIQPDRWYSLTKSIPPPYLLLTDIFYTWMAQSLIRTLTSKERYGRIFKTSPYRTYPRQQRSSSGSHQSNWGTESCVASRSC